MAHRTKVFDQPTKQPSSHHVLIFTVAEAGAQLETRAANLSKSKLENSHLSQF